VRADVLRATPIPEDYFLYWEELEWFWRLEQRGHEVLFVPAATVVHCGGRGDVRAEKSALLARNAVRCVRRTQGRLAALAAYGVVIVWNVRLVLVDAARARARPRVRARCAGLRAAVASWREIR
jgi:GT2 family glycosyltransferase